VTRRDRKARGGDSAPRALRFSQRLAPLSERTLPWLPEWSNQLVMGGAFSRWPGLWGLTASSARFQESRLTLERAFPDQDVDRLLSEWVRARGRGMGVCVNYLARWKKGRPTRLIRPTPGFGLPDGPCVFAFLHYSIDPVVQLACMSAAPGRSVRCVTYPIQPEIEDDRELWLAGAEIPPEIAEMLLKVTDPRWVATGIDHLREGGAIFMALDAPFDAYRPAMTTIPVGQTQLPLAPSVELFADVDDVQLVLAWPYPGPRGSWMLDVRRAASVDELAGLAEEWIELHLEHWAGLPFLTWRLDAPAMRDNVRKFRAGIALG
jgi:hypothetical protein